MNDETESPMIPMTSNEEESEEKLMLSASCIYFLKHCSMNYLLWPCFTNLSVNQHFVKSLICEEKL